MKCFCLLFILSITIVLLGCAQIPPQWDCQERNDLYNLSENALTQIEMNKVSYKYANIAKNRMLAALRYKLSTLYSDDEVFELLKEQAAWQSWVDKANQEPMTDGNLAPLYENQREEERYFQRFTALTLSDDLYRISKVLNKKFIRFNQQNHIIEFGEIAYRYTDEFCYYCKNNASFKHYNQNLFFPVCAFPHYEYLARINFNFCRSIDNYIIAVVEPTNYGSVPGYDEKQQVNLCIWKDDENTANYLLGNEITIKTVAIDGDVVKVSFSDKNGILHCRDYDYRQINNNCAIVVVI